jgi:RNA polymerase sigma-70 factor (ECF subfamily)
MSDAGNTLPLARLDSILPPAGRHTPQAPGHFYFPDYRCQGRRGKSRPRPVEAAADSTSTHLRRQEAGPLHPSDLELIRQAAEGDSRAFHALADRHAGELFRLALSLSATRADAEDVVQETLLGAYRGMRKFDARASVKTWLKRILVRQAARTWNKSRASRKALALEALETEPRPSAPAVREGMATGSVDRKIDIAAVLKTLPREYREILVLREFEQMSYTEIAEALGVPQGTVESRLHRARAELKTKLQSYKA